MVASSMAGATTAEAVMAVVDMEDQVPLAGSTLSMGTMESTTGSIEVVE